MKRKAHVERPASQTTQFEPVVRNVIAVGPPPILCSQAQAWEMLAIGKTLGATLLASGQLESVRIGSRRLVVIASVKRLAGVDIDQHCEA